MIDLKTNHEALTIAMENGWMRLSNFQVLQSEQEAFVQPEVMIFDRSEAVSVFPQNFL